jgi:hypothetical protein
MRLTFGWRRTSASAAEKSVALMTLVGGVAATLLAPVAFAAPSEHRFVLVSVADQAGQPLLGLQPDDFTVENGGAPCAVIGIAPASYPLAIILDTSSYARTDFRALQLAVERLVDGLSPREIAVYTSGEPASRIQDFTKDQKRVARAVASPVAAPNATTHTLDTILRASNDLALLNAPVTGIVVVSGGGIEMSPPPGQQVWTALLASGTILNVIEERTLRMEPGTPQLGQGDVLQALTTRTHGKYLHGTSAAVYASGLEAVRRQLDAQSILEYVVSPGAPRSLSLRVKPPAIVVMAVGLDQ